MNFKLIFAIVAFVILSANCEECPAFCTMEYDPVCGSDGITYGSACILEQQNCEDNTEITSTEGECLEPTSNGCERQVLCTEQVDPVCGSDGETYTNYCAWYVRNCAKPETTYTNGSCTDNEQNETEDCPQFCTKIYQPVCGSDNVTYGNKCLWKQLYCNDTEADYTEGACPGDRDCSDIVCPAIYKPVCGSDGVQYSNGCEAERANCNNQEEITYTEGECSKSENNCEELVCLAVYDPVCGSDGKTYGNACNLAQENCKNKTKITSTEGACETDETTTEGKICTTDYRPVCGSDGITYSNVCQFETNCEDENATYTEGKCHPKDVST